MSNEQLKYPKWQAEFEEAIVEFDSKELVDKVQRFEMAVFVRLQELSSNSDHHDEKQAIADALATIRDVKRNKLRTPIGRKMKQVERDPKKHGVGKTVLVVDDHAIMRKMLATAFLSDGFKTCGEADNGKEGIEVAKQIKPDVIILDLSMPIMNGLQAAPELKRLFPDTPIILFSLYASGLSQEAERAGIDLVISKDEGLSVLVSKAHDLMENE